MPPVIREQRPPCLQVGDRPLDRARNELTWRFQSFSQSGSFRDFGLRIFSAAAPFSFLMSCWFPVTGSEIQTTRPWRFVMTSEPWPVALHFPTRRFFIPVQGQHGLSSRCATRRSSSSICSSPSPEIRANRNGFPGVESVCGNSFLTAGEAVVRYLDRYEDWSAQSGR